MSFMKKKIKIIRTKMISDQEFIEQHGYQVISTISTSQDCSIFKVLHEKTQQICCIKVLRNKMIHKEITGLSNELQILKNIDHPLIVQFYESFKQHNNGIESTYISIEYLERGTLLDYANANGKLGEECCRSIFTQIITALDYLHNEQKVVHRDIKAENILLDQNFNVRICDFDLSTKINESEGKCYNLHQVGSLGYMAPEVIKKETYDTSIDIWSTGVLLFALLSGYLPFEAPAADSATNAESDTCLGISNKIVYSEPVYPDDISESAKDLLKRMLKKNPEERITLSEIIEHPWFNFNQHICIKNHISILDTIGSLTFRPDNGIVEDLKDLGYSTHNLRISLFMKDDNEATAAFRILRRAKIQYDMIDYCSSSSSSEGEIQIDDNEIETITSRLSIISPKERSGNMPMILLMNN